MAVGRTGRPERPISNVETPAGRFAQELRRLRATAGDPSYRDMAREAHYSAGTLSAAARGEQLPTLPVVRAFVTACGADPDEWERRWRDVTEETPEPATPRRTRRFWLLTAAAVTVIAAVIVVIILRLPEHTSGTKPPPKAVPGPSTAVRPSTAVPLADNADPTYVAGCTINAIVMDHVEVTAIINGRPSVQVGELVLRKGGVGCPAGWTQFRPGPNLPAGVKITVEVRRPSDGHLAVFDYANDGKNVYTNVLLTRSGCLVASVLLGDPAAPIGSATTRCLADPGG